MSSTFSFVRYHESLVCKSERRERGTPFLVIALERATLDRHISSFLPTTFTVLSSVNKHWIYTPILSYVEVLWYIVTLSECSPGHQFDVCDIFYIIAVYIISGTWWTFQSFWNGTAFSQLRLSTRANKYNTLFTCKNRCCNFLVFSSCFQWRIPTAMKAVGIFVYKWQILALCWMFLSN